MRRLVVATLVGLCCACGDDSSSESTAGKDGAATPASDDPPGEQAGKDETSAKPDTTAKSDTTARSDTSPAPDATAAKDAGPIAGSTAAPAGAGPTIAYPDTEQGLEQLVRDLLAAMDERRDTDAARLADSLRLSDEKKWFRAQFGKRGRKLAADYRAIASDLGNLALAMRDASKKRGLTEIEVTKLSAADDPDAVGYQVAALEKAPNTPLYSVRLRALDGSDVFHVWSFVFQDGRFRFIGKMKGLARTRQTPSGKDANEFTKAVAERILAAEKPGNTGTD